MQLLWEEYGAQHSGRSYSYPRFCALKGTGKPDRNAQCAKLIRPATNALLITVVAPLRCTIRKPTLTMCVKRRCFRRAWRIQLHLCRGKLEVDAAQLAGKPYPCGQFIWWLQRDHGLRQSQSGCEQSLTLRSATESKLSAVSRALWRCSTADPSSPSSG